MLKSEITPLMQLRNAKQKILPLYLKAMRQSGAKPRHLLADLYQAARSYLW